MMNHVHPLGPLPTSIISSIRFMDGCSYAFVNQDRWVWLTLHAPAGKLFAENRKPFLQRFHWSSTFRAEQECEFLAHAFKVMAKGFVDGPEATPPTNLVPC